MRNVFFVYFMRFSMTAASQLHPLKATSTLQLPEEENNLEL